MTRLSDDQLRRHLRAALPVAPADQTAGTDVWPRVRGRIERGAPAPAPLDWALASAVVVLCALEPALVSVLLFHL